MPSARTNGCDGRWLMSELLVSATEHQTRLCQNLHDLPLGRASWSRLHKQSETRSIFLTWDWLSTWWECYGADAELYTFAVLRNDELVGIAPLQLRRDDGLRVVEFLGTGLSDYADVIAAAENKPWVIATIFEALVRRRDRWDVLRLQNIPSASATMPLLEQQAQPEGWVVRKQSAGACPALSLEKSRTFAETCARKRSLVRHTRYFEHLAPLAFSHVLDSDEVADLLPHFFEQHRDRRFMAGDRSLFDDMRNRRFFERVSQTLLESGWLRFSALRWRDELLAFHFGFLYDRVFTWYMPSFNVDYARYSPGEVMLKRLLEDALAADAREFDFALGQTAHKERFANVKRENVSLEIVQPRAHEVVRPGPPGETTAAAKARQRRARWGRTHRFLWRAQPLPPVPSEFRVQWARYSQIKAMVRQEGVKSDMLIAALARMRHGERAVVALWQERPIALLWLVRDPEHELAAQGFDVSLPQGAAFTSDSSLASDLQGSPRRETLMPALQTFLAAEGVSSLYGVTFPGGPVPLPERCGGTVEPVARRTTVGLLLGRFSYQKSNLPKAD